MATSSIFQISSEYFFRILLSISYTRVQCSVITSVHVGFVVEKKVTLWQTFLHVLRFSSSNHKTTNALHSYSPLLRRATGPTSQHVITISVCSWDFTSEPALGWTQSQDVNTKHCSRLTSLPGRHVGILDYTKLKVLGCGGSL